MRLIGSSIERTTAATDVILSLAAAGSILYLQCLPSAATYRGALWSWAFGLVALSAALGAAYHGLDMPPAKRDVLWQILTACLGTAISLFLVGVLHDACGLETAGKALPVMLAAGLLVFAISRVFPGLFLVFIAYEALVLLAALGAYAWLAASDILPGAGWISAGVIVSILAAGAQAIRSLRVRIYWEFDHNGIFHLVQSAGVVLICMGLTRA